MNREECEQQDGNTAAPRRRRGMFYGWWIVIAGGLGMSITAGINFHGFSNFIIPLTNEFGWSRTLISGIFSLARMESGLLGPLEGWLVDRVGPRRLMLVGIPLMGVGYLLMSRVDSLAAFFFVYIFAITLGNSLGMSTPMTASVANWFNRKRGLAFGIMWAGVGLGGFFVPAVGWLITTYDWRMASVIIGVFIIVIGIPIASLMRHRPEPYGYMPDGAIPDSSSDAAGGAQSARARPVGGLHGARGAANIQLLVSYAVDCSALAGERRRGTAPCPLLRGA